MAPAPSRGPVQEIQAELEEDLARFGFPPRMVQQGRNVRQAQRDAHPRETIWFAPS